jgi:D-alanyl-lipoteichoic acid acyltransferase DltB (MBOAT superfamily)
MLASSMLTLVDWFASLRDLVWEPLARAPWGEWRGFWLQRSLIFDLRFLVCFYLPLVPVLWLFPRRHVRTGITLTSLVFLAYCFGILYAPFWLGMCFLFYWLSERFAVEAKRKDVWQWGPPLAAIAMLVVWYLIALRLNTIRIPVEWNYWLFHHVPWLFPLGARKLPWEAYHVLLPANFEQHPLQLFFLMFCVPQNNGLVIFMIRMMHYFSELKRGTIPREQRTPGNFLAFVSFGPTVVMGPIERFADFQTGLAHCHERREWRDLAAGGGRIVIGMLKNLFCVLYLLHPIRLLGEGGYYTRPEQVHSYGTLFFGIHLQVLCLYLAFSGYSDIAIGQARLLGYRALENFKYPWLSTSLADMWRRWHITFSFILRDYVFIPLVRYRWGALASSLLTFFVCGLLHNMSLPWVIWGLTMGLMVWVYQRWARWMRDLDRHPSRRLSAVRRAWLKLQPLPRLCAWFVTINAFCLSGLIALGGTGGLRVAWELVRRPVVWLAAQF